jgi:hypothetical protein
MARLAGRAAAQVEGEVSPVKSAAADATPKRQSFNA